MNLNEALSQYLDSILEANKITNVTSIRDKQQAQILHLEDSLVGLPFINQAPEGKYADIGTGGGFPGVPIALATQRESVLIDSVRKKTDIINDCLSELNYPNKISTYHGRIEDITKDNRESFAVISARALSSLPSLLELASPLLMKNGLLVCYKANISDEELMRGNKVAKLVGMTLVEKYETVLSDQITNRTILVYKKIGQSTIMLPRKVGLAQKQPLQ